jgi:hypothetical protein
MNDLKPNNGVNSNINSNERRAPHKLARRTPVRPLADDRDLECVRRKRILAVVFVQRSRTETAVAEIASE